MCEEDSVARKELGKADNEDGTDEDKEGTERKGKSRLAGKKDGNAELESGSAWSSADAGSGSA